MDLFIIRDPVFNLASGKITSTLYFMGERYAPVEAEYVEGFYGKGYVAVLHGLYEYNPHRGEAYPNSIIIAVAGLIALTGLILYAVSKRL